jgi:hypothetical protein
MAVHEQHGPLATSAPSATSAAATGMGRLDPVPAVSKSSQIIAAINGLEAQINAMTDRLCARLDTMQATIDNINTRLGRVERDLRDIRF